jgi:hypothetical protein
MWSALVQLLFLLEITRARYVRPVAVQLLNDFVFLEDEACSSAMRSLRASTHYPFVISVHVRRGDNVRVHNGPSITRAVHPAYIERAVDRVLHRVASESTAKPALALLFSDSAADIEWCGAHIKLSIPSVVPSYAMDTKSSQPILVGFNVTGCGNGVAPPWCKKGIILPLRSSVFSSSSGHFGGDGSDMCLMSACDSWVLSPSTYGWWGAWLGSQRLSQRLHAVILPLPWYNSIHATTGRLDASGFIWDHRWEWLELDATHDAHEGSSCDAAIEFREPDSGWRWNSSTGPFVLRFYVWSAHGGGVYFFIDDVRVGGPYPPFQDMKLEISRDIVSPGNRVLQPFITIVISLKVCRSSCLNERMRPIMHLCFWKFLFRIIVFHHPQISMVRVPSLLRLTNHSKRKHALKELLAVNTEGVKVLYCSSSFSIATARVPLPVDVSDSLLLSIFPAKYK